MSNPQAKASRQTDGSKAAPAARIDWTRVFGYDVFLSYSRQDASHYVLSLERELMRADLQCFRDESSLPKGAALTKGITDAIGRSRAVVVVLSERSFQSEWVEKEVRYAISRKIDIVPINIDDTVKKSLDGSGLWSLLREHDYTWIDDLASNSDQHSANPATITAIGRNFRLKRANRLRRLTIAAAFLILLAISVVALFQWQRATQQLRATRSRELLLQSDVLLRSEPDQVATAGLLQLEAHLNSPSDLITEQLKRTLERLTLARAWSVDLRGLATVVGLHSSGKQLTIVHSSQAETIELETGTVARTSRLPEEILRQRDDKGTETATPLAAIRPDGAVLAYAGKSGDIILFDLQAGQLLHRIRVPLPVKVIDIAGQHVGVVTEGQGQDHGFGRTLALSVDVWSFNSQGYKSVVRIEPVEGDLPSLRHYELHLSRDGKMLGLFNEIHQGSGTPWPEWLIYNLKDSRQPSELDFSTEPNLSSGIFNPNGKTFYGLTDQNKILVMTGATGPELRGDRRVDSKGAQSLAVSSGGNLLATVGLDGIRIWRAADLSRSSSSDPQPIAYVPSTELVGESLVDLQERTDTGGAGCLLATAKNNVVTVRDCVRNTVVTRIPLSHSVQMVRLVTGGHFAVVQTEKTLEAFPLESANSEFNSQDELIKNVFVVEKNRVVVCADYTVTAWDLSTGQVLRSVRPGRLYAYPGGAAQTPFRLQSCESLANGSAVFFDVFDHFGSGGESFGGVLDLHNSDRPRDQFIVGLDVSRLPKHTSAWVIARDGTGNLVGFDPRSFPLADFLDDKAPDARPAWRSDVSITQSTIFANPSGADVAIVDGRSIRIFDSNQRKVTSEWSEEFAPVAVNFFRSRVALSDGQTKHSIRDLGGGLVGMIALRRGELVCDVAADGEHATICTSDRENPPGSKRIAALYRLRDGFRFDLKDVRTTQNNTDFSPNGKFWTSLDKKDVVVLDLANGSESFRIPVENPAGFDTTDGRLAVSNGSNVEIYDIQSRRLVDRIGESFPVSGVRWVTPNSLLLWGRNRMHFKRLWDSPAAAFCGGIKTALTPAEWNLYLPGERWRHTCHAWRDTTNSLGWSVFKLIQKLH